jgi:Domain of unknown function (DUF1905)
LHNLSFEFSSKLWVYSGKGAWHFLTLPKSIADEIKFFNPLAKGFAPLKVTAKIGDTKWNTAIFPDSKSGSFLLAIKADVRKSESLKIGDTAEVSISLQ